MTSNHSTVQVAWRCLAVGLFYAVAGVIAEMVGQTHIGSHYVWRMPFAGNQLMGLLACAAQASAAAWLFPPAREDLHLAGALTGAWRGRPSAVSGCR
jgi:hypothetical protein